MNRSLFTKLLPVAFFSLSSVAFAIPASVTIGDNFVGGQDNVVPARDVIGDANAFDIQNMAITIDRAAGTLQVKIATQWFDPTLNGTFNFGPGYDVKSGDLFISTNGWAPAGAAPHAGDDASNGEAWEFVLDTSDGNLYGGAFGISLTQNEIVGPLLDPTGDFAYRNNQETRRSGGGTVVGTGTVASTLAADGSIAFFTYDLLLADLGITNPNDPIALGFHWTMTCANDVMETGIISDGGGIRPSETPEPGTLLLLGMGLLGFGLRRRVS